MAQSMILRFKNLQNLESLERCKSYFGFSMHSTRREINQSVLMAIQHTLWLVLCPAHRDIFQQCCQSVAGLCRERAISPDRYLGQSVYGQTPCWSGRWCGRELSLQQGGSECTLKFFKFICKSPASVEFWLQKRLWCLSHLVSNALLCYPAA